MRNQTLLTTVLLGALSTPMLASAEDAPPSPLTFNVGVVSDYLYRGISQSHGKPAVQAGVDYAFASGFYVGAWASSITWVKDFLGRGSAEVDVYGGYKGSAGDVSYDVGYLTYNYPDHGDAIPGSLANPNTQEVYASLGYKWLAAKYSYTTSSHFMGWYGGTAFTEKTRGSDYLELNANYELGDGWTLVGHVGHQKIKNWNTSAFTSASYTDWKLGGTKDLGFGIVGLAYSDTNTSGTCDSSTGGTNPYCWGTNKSSGNFKDVSKGKLLLSFLKNF